ncbi:hypothetical protein ET475_17105 [Microbacterium protaetiae]|uniref:HNH endonuclease n=1 Tax=Microbacterium protaetiae TaxID=2509458 RepID=A0A4P6EGG8_9MICO|nr:hypothetical protein [Microbacterium protaetiae]QAY61512.1 hypothetical protein ET475_17105 [Microbacterium protaetiae]
MDADVFESAREPVDDVFVLRSMFESAEADQYAANRAAARRAEQLADILDFARGNPGVYVDDGIPGPSVREEIELAERCAAVEAASRMCLSETEVHALAEAARTGRSRLPGLWHHVREGFATPAHVQAAGAHLAGMTSRAELLTEYDRELSDLALRVSLAVFRRKAKDIAHRLTGATNAEKHAQALKERKVVVTDLPDDVSWFGVLMPTWKAHAAFRRLTSTAKHHAKDKREDRTRHQLRADLATALLLGVGTEQMVQTKVFVTIPLDRLAPDARVSVRPHAPGTTGLDLNQEALVPGDGPLDDATARQILCDAGAFTRVITDPITGVILDIDRRSRRATDAQRAWLALQHGTCLRDGCDRLALDADIDHWCQFHGPKRGPTNIANLDPLCDPDHVIKDFTKVRHRRRRDRSIELEFPTGHRTAAANPLPDDPPF